MFHVCLVSKQPTNQPLSSHEKRMRNGHPGSGSWDSMPLKSSWWIMKMREFRELGWRENEIINSMERAQRNPHKIEFHQMELKIVKRKSSYPVAKTFKKSNVVVVTAQLLFFLDIDFSSIRLSQFTSLLIMTRRQMDPAPLSPCYKIVFIDIDSDDASQSGRAGLVVTNWHWCTEK